MTTTCVQIGAPAAEHPVQSAALSPNAPNWAALSLAARLAVIKRARHALAAAADDLVACLASLPGRNAADSLVAEVLPLLEACKFLERNAAHILKPRILGKRGLPFWLSGLHSRVERVALGRVLVIGPANYPLLLPGVQTLQALAAGNQVVWKPGRNGAAVAHRFAQSLHDAGLPQGVLTVTDESIDSVAQEICTQPDKIIFTGSAPAGKAVARLAADRAIPLIAELSGCDAVVVLPSADATRVAAALAFGMRFNGSATCMAPRRLFLVGEENQESTRLLEAIATSFRAIPPVELTPATRRQLTDDLAEAEQLGAKVIGQIGAPILVLDGKPQMRIAQADLFAPVLTVLRVPDRQALAAAYAACPYALTLAIFGNEREAEQIGHQLCACTVLLNDLIVPTADPRIPFGGRRASGYGVTRGAEGLLEMTASKSVLVRRGKSIRHYQATGDAHARLFRGVIGWQHAAGWSARIAGFKAMVQAAREME